MSKRRMGGILHSDPARGVRARSADGGAYPEASRHPRGSGRRWYAAGPDD
jgi:hypothetical protein